MPSIVEIALRPHRLASLTLLAWVIAVHPAGATGEPLLYRKVEVPRSLRATVPAGEGREVTFGGDLRLGDLTGNGRADLLVYRSAHGGMKPCFFGAFTLDGDVLWSAGEGGEQPNRPGPVAIHDIDGDGDAEVVALAGAQEREGSWLDLRGAALEIRDGRTGRVERRAAPDALRSARAAGRHTPWNAPNWVHQRVLIARLRDTETPRDFVIKLGLRVLAFDEDLDVLWKYDIPPRWKDYGRHTAYIPAVGDIDEDGRDEVLGGYYLLDEDGTPLWEKTLGPHMDSVAITEWDGGRKRAICSGHGHVLDSEGNVVLALGGDLVPHGQEVRVAEFLRASAGPEMVIRRDGHTTGVITVSNEGRVLHRFDLDESPNNTGMEVVYFHGRDRPALLYGAGTLWRANGERVADLPDLPAPKRPIEAGERPGWRMAWHHAIPADLCGDAREELCLYDPWDTAVRIYTPAPLDRSAYRGYRPGPRQYNARLMD